MVSYDSETILFAVPSHVALSDRDMKMINLIFMSDLSYFFCPPLLSSNYICSYKHYFCSSHSLVL